MDDPQVSVHSSVQRGARVGVRAAVQEAGGCCVRLVTRLVHARLVPATSDSSRAPLVHRVLLRRWKALWT